MARSLALGLSLFAAGLLLVGAVAAAFGLIVVIGSESEDAVALGTLLVGSALWAATTILNAVSLFDDLPRVPRPALHIFNVASLMLLALLAITSFATGTASRAEIAILVLPAVSIPLGYWQAAKRRGGIV